MRPQVFVYLRPKQKERIATMAKTIGVSEAELMRLLALPGLRKLEERLESGADPDALREGLKIRMNNAG